jgi:hypothetical protein
MGAILYTEGGLLQYLDGRDYIGNYHIMPDGTPMGGAVHTGKEDILQYNPNRAKVSTVNPAEFTTQGFELSDQSIIPDSNIDSFFDPIVDRIEFLIYDISKNLLLSQPNFRNYRIENNENTDQAEIEEIIVNPAVDVFTNGFTNGSLFAVYNFITPEVNDIFISEISADRTEIRLQSNVLSSEDIREEVTSLKNKIDSVGFFDELYLNLGNNKYYIVVNLQLDVSTSPTSFLVKLYQPLPDDITTKTQLEIVSKISETQAYEVDFPDIIIPVEDTISIKGPNLNLKIKDKVNNSTDYKNLTTLTTSSFTASLDQSSYLLNQTGISLNPSYSISDYSDFVHFSSAKKRLENFYYKVGQIEANQNSIDALRLITGSSSGSATTLTSVAVFENRITDTIKNFDGFEYFLYYNSSSDAYPKSNSNAPYLLQSTGSTEVLNWLGSDIVGSTYYGGALLSASRFDDDNASNLKYSIPEFIRDNSDNNNYIEFVNLVGQHFDDIWLYIKSITQKLRATNNLETGIQPELVEETLKSFGYEVYGNNFDNNDIFTSLIGINESGSYFSETNQELITTAISASNTPVPINNVSKEVYKRLYHNLVYLAKRKGTVSGLRSLINIWGLPDTILRIYEFGGKDKINSNDWDLYRRIYNREILTHQFDADRGKEYNGGVETEWKINSLWSASAAVSNLTGSVPSTVEFRFKSDIDPAITPSQSIPLQPLWGLKDNSGDTKVLAYLEYNGSGSATGSFSGSAIDPNYQYADLVLAISGSPPTSASVSLPFYNKDWWNVRIQMQELGLANTNESRYQIATANKIYNGKDGTKIGFEGSNKLNQISGSWVNSTTSSFALSRSFNDKQYSNFSGSLQELRYWTLCFNNQSTINEEVWDNHVMDPLSIETGYLTGSLSPVEHLVFRSREGEDISLITGSQGNIKLLNSIHPKISGTYPTTSSFASNSSYSLITSSINSNTEIQFLNSPNLGIKNRISDKIHSYNSVAYGDTLSAFRSIQQNYEASQSFTEDNNMLQVAFSPQDEVNDDIIHELGFNNNITEQLADPRNLSSSLDYYDGLRDIALRYFEKYVKTNANDYYRLIKYIDNSLFKAIKNYVPARTSVSTGIVVKQHLLERNRVRPPQVDLNTTIAKTPETGSTVNGTFEIGNNSPLTFKNIAVEGIVKSQPRGFITGSPIQVFTGGTGGSFEKFNSLHFHPYGVSGSGPTERLGFDISQSFIETVSTLSGSVNTLISNQDEFYNGEFNGSTLIVTTQSLNPGCKKFLNINIQGGELLHEYDRFIYNPITTSLAPFENPRTSPRSGEIFFFTNNNPSPTRFEKIKISNTTRTGVDLSDILSSLNNITFDFIGNNKNVNVSFVGGGSDFAEFDVISPTFAYDSDNFTSNFINYSASANKTSSLVDIRISEPVSASFTHFNYVVPISDFDTETDPENLFDLSTGEYSCPLTNNRRLSITGSVSGSYTFDNTKGIGPVQYLVDIQLINKTSNYVFLQNGLSVGLDPGFSTTTQFNFNLSTIVGNTVALVTGDKLGLQANVRFNDQKTLIKGSGSLNISASSFAVNHVNTVSDPNPTSSLLSIEPSFLIDGNEDFERSFDCQPLLNNSIENRDSTLYQDVDYTTGLLTPTNVVPIINNDATPAQTPDSNYTQQSRILPRYEGSKLQALKINSYNGPGGLLRDGTRWGGDVSFGKTPVIQRVKPFFSYFQLLVPTSPELENATQVKLAYLIDAEGNPFKPLLNSPTFFNVEGTFESGDQVDIALEDTLQTDDTSLVNAAVGINLDNFNTSADVIYGARRVDPIITSQRVSINDVSNVSDAFENTITFTSILGEPNNFYFLAPSDFNSITYQTQNNHTLLGYSTFAMQDQMGGFDAATGIYTIQSPGPVPGNDISFEIRGGFKIDSINQSISNLPVVTSLINTPQAKIQIIRNRSSVETILAEEILSYTFTLNPGATPPFVTEFQQVNLISSPTEMRVGDEIFARLVIINPNVFSVINSTRALIGTPTSFPTTTVEPDFFRTGSNYTNFITASVSFSQFIDLTSQQSYANSTFKPINENISFRPGDELRFEGSEALAFKIYDVDLVTSGHATGSLLLNVQPEVPPEINLNQFLLRRYNKDGTSVLINLVPPSSSFATTKGVMKNTLISEELGENIDIIISDLVKEGVLTNK